MAHTLGGLGDEYFTPGTTASGGSSANTSPSQESSMRNHKTKWYQWLGKPSPDGGVVGAYEGANYVAKGLFRPSQNSEMRTLGRVFNPPSVEALVKAFYLGRGGRGSIDPIDSVTPAATSQGVTDLTHPLQVNLVPLVGRAYSVRWTIDAAPVAGSEGRTSLDLTKAPLKKGAWNRVAVAVVDQNPAVLDRDFRLRHMTQTRSWSVWGG